MTFAVEHAGAVADLQDNGAAVTFTRSAAGYTAATDSVTLSTTTVAGYAIRVRGDPATYRDLGLTESHPATLLFAPTTYGGRPEPGDTVTWESLVHTVRDVAPVAPDGTAIICRVVIAR